MGLRLERIEYTPRRLRWPEVEKRDFGLGTKPLRNSRRAVGDAQYNYFIEKHKPTGRIPLKRMFSL